jgi:signal transduction histidine kinase
VGVRLRIEDNGPGLAVDELRAVFDPFFVRSGDPRETGLRLMACYFIVHHHGGQITHETLPGGGMRLTIDLPLQPPPAVARTDEDFLQRVLLNDRLWDRILAGF